MWKEELPTKSSLLLTLALLVLGSCLLWHQEPPCHQKPDPAGHQELPAGGHPEPPSHQQPPLTVHQELPVAGNHPTPSAGQSESPSHQQPSSAGHLEHPATGHPEPPGHQEPPPSGHPPRRSPESEPWEQHWLNCSSLGRLSRLELIASGWTKAVYRGRLEDGRLLALKTVNLEGQDLESCLPFGSLGRCYMRTSAKLLRELVLLQQLSHPNVIKTILDAPSSENYYLLARGVLKRRHQIYNHQMGNAILCNTFIQGTLSHSAGELIGGCVVAGSGGMTSGPVLVATELGQPLDSVAILHLTWEERLKVALGVASLLHYLSHSPLGSLAASDLKRRQFVLVGGVLKLADLDHLSLGEPLCLAPSDCIHPQRGDGAGCISGRCRGHNERANILRAGEDLLSHLVPRHMAPPGLQEHVESLLKAYNGELDWDTGRILEETQKLAEESR